MLPSAVRAVVVVAIMLAAMAAEPPAEQSARWLPRGLLPTTAVLADVLAANARASGGDDARLDERRERWTYVNGALRINVDVNVRGDDFRTSLQLKGLTYTAGRVAGARWRGDGNGIVHGVEADLQGDALDRAPQAVFRLDPATCTLAGEARLPALAWVVATHRDGDKPAFLYVDSASGTIVREVMHDGKRVVTTAFDRFEPLDGGLRARHWRVDDGSRANTLDVTVDAIEPGSVSTSDVGFPTRRLFAPATPLAAPAELPASFRRDRITLAVNVDGDRRAFVLDTGTTSITVAPDIANRFGGVTLEHAILPRVSVGPLALDGVSVLSIPAFNLDGILGLDFFFGHVVEIDYRQQRVRVFDEARANAIFADPRMTIVSANVDEGLPLVPASIGALSSAAFALDTGSPHLYVMRPFMRRFAAAIAHSWTPDGISEIESYLEGGIEIQPYEARDFIFGNTDFTHVTVGGQIPSKGTDDLDMPFDGIIGTDVLRNFDLYIDYDNARLGIRDG